jgi:prepilin-type N-terminal cleavage/methylation domain-containing protein
MMNSRAANRSGFTLVEVMIALVITAVIGSALTSVLVNQSRFIDQQEKLSNARQVSRSALNMLMAELRMVETTGGIVAASTTSLTVRVPYAMGLVCGSNTSGGGSTRVSLLPVDSAIFSNTAPDGWAYRNSFASDAGYTYALMTGMNDNSSTDCANAQVFPVPGGRLRNVQPSAPAPIGVPMFLYRTVTYTFAASTSVPGSIALWRSAGGTNEELVAPFVTGVGFRFFVDGSWTAEATAPSDLSTLRGVEIDLTGASERPPSASQQQERAVLTTAVFFKNAL